MVIVSIYICKDSKFTSFSFCTFQVGGWATEGINPALYARALTQRIIDLGGDHDDAVDTDEINSTDTTATADTRTH